jgi:hypothetical protein
MPDPTTLSPLFRIKRIARWMRLVLLFGMGFEIVGYFAIWIVPKLRQEVLLSGLNLSADTVTWSLESAVVGFAIGLVPVALLFSILWEALALFRHYALGEIFSSAAVLRLRRISSRLLCVAIAQPVTRTLLVLDLTFGNPPGHRLLSIGFSGTDYIMAAFGGLLLAISWVMAEAAALSEENSRFV